ncbi:signal peptidase I [Blastococcus sp. SYSU D00820]
MTAMLASRPAAALALRPAAEAAAPAAAPAAGRTGLLRAALRVTVRWATRLLVAVAVLAFLGLAVGPHVFGYRTATMLTASMAPGIEPGDVVVTTPLAVEDVREGMVISYHIPIDDHRVVTHRVVSVEHGADGSVAVQTAGDANDAIDPWTAVLSGDTAYQVRAVVPGIGNVITALRDPLVSKALVYGAPALLAAWLLLTIWRPVEDEDDADADADATDDDADAEASR